MPLILNMNNVIATSHPSLLAQLIASARGEVLPGTAHAGDANSAAAGPACDAAGYARCTRSPDGSAERFCNPQWLM